MSNEPETINLTPNSETPNSEQLNMLTKSNKILLRLEEELEYARRLYNPDSYPVEFIELLINTVTAIAKDTTNQRFPVHDTDQPPDNPQMTPQHNYDKLTKEESKIIDKHEEEASEALRKIGEEILKLLANLNEQYFLDEAWRYYRSSQGQPGYLYNIIFDYWGMRMQLNPNPS